MTICNINIVIQLIILNMKGDTLNLKDNESKNYIL